MLGSDLTEWPPNQILSIHWGTTGQTTLELHWLMLSPSPVVFQWQCWEEPYIHWDTTGTTLADTSTQRCPSGNPVLIGIIGTHWKTTGATNTLGCHWNHTGLCQHPVVSQWQSSVNLHIWNTMRDNWMANGSTLETHWLPIILTPMAFQCTLGSKCQAHWIATGNRKWPFLYCSLTWDRRIFILGIPILGRRPLYIKTAHGCWGFAVYLSI